VLITGLAPESLRWSLPEGRVVEMAFGNVNAVVEAHGKCRVAPNNGLLSDLETEMWALWKTEAPSV
jgi:hypothetical protein